MAKCECGEIWAWEWCHDLFVDGKGEEHKKVTLEDHSNLSCVSSIDVYVCKCGAIKCAISDSGEVFFDCPEFRKIDWEKDEDSVAKYPPNEVEVMNDDLSYLDELLDDDDQDPEKEESNGE